MLFLELLQFWIIQVEKIVFFNKTFIHQVLEVFPCRSCIVQKISTYCDWTTLFFFIRTEFIRTSRLELAWAVSVQVGRHLGGWLATTVVATINNIIFFSFFFLFSPSSTFLIEGVLGSNKHKRTCSDLTQPWWPFWQFFHHL